MLQLSVAALVESPLEATIVDILDDGSSLTVTRHARELGTTSLERLPVLVPPDGTATLSALSSHEQEAMQQFAPRE